MQGSLDFGRCCETADRFEGFFQNQKALPSNTATNDTGPEKDNNPSKGTEFSGLRPGSGNPASARAGSGRRCYVADPRLQGFSQSSA